MSSSLSIDTDAVADAGVAVASWAEGLAAYPHSAQTSLDMSGSSTVTNAGRAAEEHLHTQALILLTEVSDLSDAIARVSSQLERLDRVGLRNAV